MRRLEALDGLRGLGACLIVAAHGSLVINSTVSGHAAVEGLHLLVDFFFVLSGFVIAASFQRRLESGDGLVPFLITRIGRVYPLHLATLLALVALKVGLKASGLDANLVMQMGGRGEFYSSSVLTNLFLIQGLGVERGLTWNAPAWSISVELFTYAVFALLWASLGVLQGGRKALGWIYAGLLVACPLILYAAAPTHLQSTFDYGFVRGLFGFTIGVVAFQIFRTLGEAPPRFLTPGRATVLELAAVALCAMFVWFGADTRWVVVAPYTLGAAVLLFAYERGAVSRFLRLGPLVALGGLSYSIYLVHFVLLIYQASLVRLPAVAAGALVGPADWAVVWGGDRHVGDLILLIQIAMSVAVALFTVRFVEVPGRALASTLARQWEARRRLPAQHAAEPRPQPALQPAE